MFLNKQIFIDTEKKQGNSLLTTIQRPISEIDLNLINVGIGIENEMLYNAFVESCSRLENHFNPFYYLLGYAQNTLIDSLIDIANPILDFETRFLISDKLGNTLPYIDYSRSNKAKHKIGNISNVALTAENCDVVNIGYMRHSSPLEVLRGLNPTNHFSIGDVKGRLQQVEPLIRDLRLALIDLNLLNDPVVNMSIFDLCSIARYLGYSQKIHTIVVRGEGSQKLLADQASLLLWYFLEGRQHRQQDYPTNPTNEKYLVLTDRIDDELVFIKSPISGRWWLKSPSEETQYYSISFEEYKNCVDGEVPLRLQSLIE